jgi:SAM-dependent methyltransferase
MRRAIFCHCGFDEALAELRQRYGDAKWQVLDHFDANQMTEASIRRARAIFPPAPGTMSSPYNAWPAATNSADVVFGLLAIHELRSEAERSAWFAECGRCLCKGGRLVLVEHARDAANFLAFGPGFLHFHSPASWRRCWESAGFLSLDEFRLTPFVRVFVLIAP